MSKDMEEVKLGPGWMALTRKTGLGAGNSGTEEASPDNGIKKPKQRYSRTEILSAYRPSAIIPRGMHEHAGITLKEPAPPSNAVEGYAGNETAATLPLRPVKPRSAAFDAKAVHEPGGGSTGSLPRRNLASLTESVGGPTPASSPTPKRSVVGAFAHSPSADKATTYWTRGTRSNADATSNWRSDNKGATLSSSPPASSPPPNLPPLVAQNRRDLSALMKNPSGGSSKDREKEKVMILEDPKKVWHYKDPQGVVQGPFAASQLMEWLKGGYYPDDLPVRRTDEQKFRPLAIAFKLKSEDSAPPGFLREEKAATSPVMGTFEFSSHLPEESSSANNIPPQPLSAPVRLEDDESISAGGVQQRSAMLNDTSGSEGGLERRIGLLDIDTQESSGHGLSSPTELGGSLEPMYRSPGITNGVSPYPRNSAFGISPMGKVSGSPAMSRFANLMGTSKRSAPMESYDPSLGEEMNLGPPESTRNQEDVARDVRLEDQPLEPPAQQQEPSILQLLAKSVPQQSEDVQANPDSLMELDPAIASFGYQMHSPQEVPWMAPYSAPLQESGSAPSYHDSYVNQQMMAQRNVPNPSEAMEQSGYWQFHRQMVNQSSLGPSPMPPMVGSQNREGVPSGFVDVPPAERGNGLLGAPDPLDGRLRSADFEDEPTLNTRGFLPAMPPMNKESSLKAVNTDFLSSGLSEMPTEELAESRGIKAREEENEAILSEENVDNRQVNERSEDDLPKGDMAYLGVPKVGGAKAYQRNQTQHVTSKEEEESSTAGKVTTAGDEDQPNDALVAWETVAVDSKKKKKQGGSSASITQTKLDDAVQSGVATIESSRVEDQLGFSQDTEDTSFQVSLAELVDKGSVGKQKSSGKPKAPLAPWIAASEASGNGESKPSLREIQEEEAKKVEQERKRNVELVREHQAQVDGYVMQRQGANGSVWGGVAVQPSSTSLLDILREEAGQRDKSEKSRSQKTKESVSEAIPIPAPSGSPAKTGGGAWGSVNSSQATLSLREQMRLEEERKKTVSESQKLGSSVSVGWASRVAGNPQRITTAAHPTQTTPRVQAGPSRVTAAPPPQPASNAALHKTVAASDDDNFWEIVGNKSKSGPKAVHTTNLSQTMSSMVSPSGKKSLPTVPASQTVVAKKQEQLNGAAGATVALPQNAFGASMSQDFKRWCQAEMEKINGSSDTTLPEFLFTLGSAWEVKEYCIEYLGSSEKTRAFADEFVRRKNFEVGEAGEAVSSDGNWSVVGNGESVGKKKSRKKAGGVRVDPGVVGFDS